MAEEDAVAAAGGRRGGAEEGVVTGESRGRMWVSHAHTLRGGASTAKGTKFIQWCALTWGGDLGGDTGVDELVARGN